MYLYIYIVTRRSLYPHIFVYPRSIIFEFFVYVLSFTVYEIFKIYTEGRFVFYVLSAHDNSGSDYMHNFTRSHFKERFRSKIWVSSLLYPFVLCVGARSVMSSVMSDFLDLVKRLIF